MVERDQFFNTQRMFPSSFILKNGCCFLNFINENITFIIRK